MPPVSKIALLPDDIRDELDDKLKESHYGRIVEITEWLNELGFDVGKSGVGVYALNLKRDTAREDKRHAKTLIRLECVRIAAATGPADNVLGRAQEFLSWVEGKRA